MTIIHGGILSERERENNYTCKSNNCKKVSFVTFEKFIELLCNNNGIK